MKIKRIFTLMIMIFMSLGVCLFTGCKDPYKDVKINLDKEIVTIFKEDSDILAGGEEDEETSATGEVANQVTATIEGLGEDMVETMSILIDDPTVCSAKITSRKNNTSVISISPLLGGTTTVRLFSDQVSSKYANITVNVIEKLEDVEVNEDVKFFVTLNNTEKQITVLPNTCLNFTPSTTSEKFYSLELYGDDYKNFASYDNETHKLTIKPDAPQGVLKLQAKFDRELERQTINNDEIFNKLEQENNPAKDKDNLIIEVRLVKELVINQNVFLKINNENVFNNETNAFNTVNLVSNKTDKVSTKINLSLENSLVNTDGFNYELSANVLDFGYVDVTSVDYNEGVTQNTGKIYNATFTVYALAKADIAYIEFVVKIKEIEGYSSSFKVPFNVIELPENIEINGDKSKDDLTYTIYNNYKNAIGTPFHFVVSSFGANDKTFAINIESGEDEIAIYSNRGILLRDTTSLQSGTTIYIKSLSESNSSAVITAICNATKDSEEDIVKRTINLNLVIGADGVSLNDLDDLNAVYIQKGESLDLEFSLVNEKSTNVDDIFTDYTLVSALHSDIVKVPSRLDRNTRTFEIEALKIGVTKITIELSNGVSRQFNVVVYATFEAFGLQLPSINQTNSSVVQANYTTASIEDTSKVKTVTSAKINVNSAVDLTILTYNLVEGNPNQYIFNTDVSVVSTKFTSTNEDVITINSHGNMIAKGLGKTTIKCVVTTYVDAFKAQTSSIKGVVALKEITCEFDLEIEVIIPISTFSLIGGDLSAYAYNTLSYYDTLKGDGTITLNLKILPADATYNPKDIVWQANSSYLTLVESTGMSATYRCKLMGGQTSAITSVSVSLSANGRSFSQTKQVSISTPEKVVSINLNNVTNHTLDKNGNKIPYIYFDGRDGLNNEINSVNLQPEVIPVSSYNTNIRYIIGEPIGGDPNPVVRINEKGDIIPIRNGSCFVYVVAEDWFSTADSYEGYEDYVRVVAVKVADGKSKATAIDIYSAKDLLSINTIDGLKLNYVLQANIDLSKYVNLKPFGVFEKNILDNDNSYHTEIGVENAELDDDGDGIIPFTGTLDGCYNIFGTAVQYYISGLQLKNDNLTSEYSDNLYYETSQYNQETLNYGLFAINRGELSNLIVKVSKIGIDTFGNSASATTNFGVLAGQNQNLIENCQVEITNKDSYVYSNTTNSNIGYIAGLNSGYISNTAEIENIIVINATIDNCSSDGNLKVKVFNANNGESTSSSNKLYVGGIVGKNNTKSRTTGNETKTAIATVQGNYNYYAGNITFASQDMNTKGTINVESQTSLFTDENGIGGIAGYNNGIIKDISSEITINALNDANKGMENIGGIVGKNDYGALSGVYFSGHIKGLYNVGGIAGKFSGTLINGIVEAIDTVSDDIKLDNTILALKNAGGLVGYAFGVNTQKASITYSFVKSYFKRTISNNYDGDIQIKVLDTNILRSEYSVGGLIGIAEYVSLSKCYADVNMLITCEHIFDMYVGGLIGVVTKDTIIADTYSKGKVKIISSNTLPIDVIANAYKVVEGETEPTISVNNFYSTTLIKYDSDDYGYFPTNITGKEVYPGIATADQIKNFGAEDDSTYWNKNIWRQTENYNDFFPYIIYNSAMMLTEPPIDVQYTILPSTIKSPSDLSKLNKFIKINESTILLFKYDNEILNTIDLNEILKFTILPYIYEGENINNTFEGVFSTIRLSLASSNETVITVNKNGTLILNASGSSIITISSMLNKEAYANINIVVMDVTSTFEIYSDNKYTTQLPLNKNVLVKTGTAKEIYPKVTGNNEIMLEYGFYSNITPITVSNLDWKTDTDGKKYVDIPYLGTHIFHADSAGTITFECKAFIYFGEQKIYLPFSSTFIIQAFDGMNDFKVSHSNFVGIVLDRYEFSATVTTDIVEYTKIKIDLEVFSTKENEYVDYVTVNNNNIPIKDIVNVVISRDEKSIDYIKYYIVVDIDTNYKASEVFFTTQNLRVTITAYDNQDIDYGIDTSKEVFIKIEPQHISSVETMFYAGAETITYSDGGTSEDDQENIAYNPTEASTSIIKAGEIGLYKVFVYPEFAQIKNVYIYAYASDGNNMSIQQVGLDNSSLYMKEYKYVTLSPGPSYYSTKTDGVLYEGLHASKISNVTLDNNHSINTTSFDGYLYFKMLVGSKVENGTYYKIIVKVEDYDGNFVINTNTLYAEEAVGVFLNYNDFAMVDDFGYITSYDSENEQTLHTLVAETKRLGNNPILSVDFYKGDDLATPLDNIIYTPIDYTERETIQEDLSYRYFIRNVQIPSSLNGETIKVIITAVDFANADLVYYSNILEFLVVPYIISGVQLDGLNNKNEFNKTYGSSYIMNVKVSNIGTADNDSLTSLRRNIAQNENTFWYYENEMYTPLQQKVYKYFTIEKKEDQYFYYVPTEIGFTDRIFMAVSLTYTKGDGFIETGYKINLNAGPGRIQTGVNAGNKSLNFLVEIKLSSNYTTSEENALPINTQEELEAMEAGNYYILASDITLKDFKPLNVSIAQLNGNGYEINIQNFAIDETETIQRYGLFEEISSNTIIKNLFVTYGGPRGDALVTVSLEKITTLYFGGIAATNNGTIYNCSVQGKAGKGVEVYRTDKFEIVNYDVKIGCLVADNEGCLSYSRSELRIKTNVGMLSGIAAYNNGTISSCYYKNGILTNTSNNAQTSKVAGAVVTNATDGKILYSYVEGAKEYKDDLQATKNGYGLTYSGTVAGFVYENAGEIQDCYANIAIKTTGGRSAGFVFTNSGTIKNAYTLSRFIYANESSVNAADTPFTGTNAQGKANNTGTLTNVYYYEGNYVDSIKLLEPAKALTKIEFMEDYNFGEFSFSYTENKQDYSYFAYQENNQVFMDNYYNGLDAVWTFDKFHNAPILVEANNISVSRMSIEYEDVATIISPLQSLGYGFTNQITLVTNVFKNNPDSTIILRINNNVVEADIHEIVNTSYYFKEFNIEFTLNPNVTYENVNVQVLITKNNGQQDGVLSNELAMPVVSEDLKDTILSNELYEETYKKSFLSTDIYIYHPIANRPISETLNGQYLYSAEEGSKGNPYIISTVEDYNKKLFFKNINGYDEFTNNNICRIIADLDFTNKVIEEESLNQDFYGLLDGAGFTISGLSLIDYSKSKEYFGMFRSISGNHNSIGIVKNITLEPVEVYANYIPVVGTLAGKVSGGRVYNIRLENPNVVVRGKNIVGGVIGLVVDNISLTRIVEGQTKTDYYEYDSGDLKGTKVYYKSVVENIVANINVNATNRVSSTTYSLLTNTNLKALQNGETLAKLNDKISYAGVAIGAVIQSNGIDRLNQARVYDIIINGNSKTFAEIAGTAIGFVGEKSYVDLISVNITFEQYIKANAIAGGVVGENRGLISRAMIKHSFGQESIDARLDDSINFGSQNLKFFQGAPLAIGGIVGFNNGGTIENSVSRIDVRNSEAYIAGGLVGVTIGGSFYTSYVSGSVFAKNTIGGLIGATSTPELFTGDVATNSISWITKQSKQNINTNTDVVFDTVLGLNKWLEQDYSTFFGRTHLPGSKGEPSSDAYPIGSLIGSIQVNKDDETSSYYIDTYNCYTKKLYFAVPNEFYEDGTQIYFNLYDYGNKINSLISSGNAFSNPQSVNNYTNIYTTDLLGDALQNRFVFSNFSHTIWNKTDRASGQQLPDLNIVSNLNTKLATIEHYFIDKENGNKETKVTKILIDGVNGEEKLGNEIGSIFNPYKIQTPRQLSYFSSLTADGANAFMKDKTYMSLADNISLIAYKNWTPIGSGYKNSKRTIVFEGNNKTISGINAVSATTTGAERVVGLFGYLNSGSMVSNLKTNVNFNLMLDSGIIYVGGIASSITSATIENCEVNGKIDFLNNYSASFVIGGVVGQMLSSENNMSYVKSSISKVNITNNKLTSKLLREEKDGKVTYKDTSIASMQINHYVGGIAGNNNYSKIMESTNNGKIMVRFVDKENPTNFSEPTIDIETEAIVPSYYDGADVFTDKLYIAGIVAKNNSYVEKCVNNGTLYSYSYVGGIVASNEENPLISLLKEQFSINRCLNNANIYLVPGTQSDTFAGGIVGDNLSSVLQSINNGLINVKTRAKFNAGGIAGKITEKDNSAIISCYARALTDVNSYYNIVNVNPLTSYDGTNLKYYYGANPGNDGKAQNFAGLIVGSAGSSTIQIFNCYAYGNLEVTDNIGALTVQNADGTSTNANKDRFDCYSGSNSIITLSLQSVVGDRHTTNYCYSLVKVGKLMERIISKNNQTEVALVASDQTYGTNWTAEYYKAKDYINLKSNIYEINEDATSIVHLPELIWNAKRFNLNFNVEDDQGFTGDFISLNYQDKSLIYRNPIRVDTSAGMVKFELAPEYKDTHEIYYIYVNVNDNQRESFEIFEQDLTTYQFTINGFETEESYLFNINPNIDDVFEITIKVRLIEEE